MSLSLAVGIADNLFNSHRGVQVGGLAAAFLASVAVSPAVGLIAGIAALGAARCIGRGEKEVNPLSVIMADHREQKAASTPRNTGP